MLSHPTTSERASQTYVERFCADPRAPFLVSFPRTGSHWLRMMMELYFGRPTLVRAFYHLDRTDYLLCHTHDLDLACERGRVIYLYRDPIDTVFSQIMYEKQSPTDAAAAREWAGRYAEHLSKWLVDERFTREKLIVRYEDLRENLPAAFARIAGFFGQSLNGRTLEDAARCVTRDEVKRKTTHDAQVVQLKRDYEAQRQEFRETLGPTVRDVVFGGFPALRDALGGSCSSGPPAARQASNRETGISAVVCSCNEAHYLRACLESLSFCDERIVIDLDSTDQTVQVARACGARVVDHPRVAVVEQVRRFGTEQARNDWVIFPDPDEVFPLHRGAELRRAIAAQPSAGLIKVPLEYYFRRRLLRYGRWGGVKFRDLVFHRRRVELTPDVHAGIRLRDPWQSHGLPAGDSAGDRIAHYWIDSYAQLFAKHRRYARREAEPRYRRGERFAWRSALRRSLHEVRRVLLWRRGWRDGLQGVFLSLFWGWYFWKCQVELRRHQRSAPVEPAGAPARKAAA